MPKNIVIFSDGTGQRSGERFEENRTNIYKLYRASKCGPDSAINPEEQFAFYDPGIGTIPPHRWFLGAAFSRFYNLICQATGLGLTGNIKDCYTAILKVYEPGDRIFLFGFSRGAYTVRCLAAVLHFCGVATQSNDGSPLKKDKKTLDGVAAEAVERVYQHVGSPKESAYVEQRKLLGERFRNEHKSEVAYPHFIGVFDTVASVANYASLAGATGISLIAICGAAGALGYWMGGFWVWFVGLFILAAFVSFIAYLKTHLRFAFGLPGIPWLKTVHLNALHMQFYDKSLNTNVGWARHALAIDECRKDFDRVPWGYSGDDRKVGTGEPVWLKQVWFSGNHADIGGGYPDTESRLSDAALEWMLDQARKIPNGLLFDSSVLKPYPSAKGMQHDETKSFAFRFAAKIVREINPEAPLHPSVIERFKLPSVLQLDEAKPYRPEGLRGHKKVSEFYDTN